jgi:hypothetical protein
MNSKIILDEQTIYAIFEQESKRIVGTCLHRFETHTTPEEQKKAIKDVLYENLRVLRDMVIINGKDSIHLVSNDKK